MHKKFKINRTKIKGDCQSGRKAVTHKSKRDLPLTDIDILIAIVQCSSENMGGRKITKIGKYVGTFFLQLLLAT